MYPRVIMYTAWKIGTDTANVYWSYTPYSSMCEDYGSMRLCCSA